MARANKCDRCGSYYDKKNRVQSINGCFVKSICLQTSGPYMVLDLCDSCIDELYKFLGLDDEEKENENN